MQKYLNEQMEGLLHQSELLERWHNHTRLHEGSEDRGVETDRQEDLRFSDLERSVHAAVNSAKEDMLSAFNAIQPSSPLVAGRDKELTESQIERLDKHVHELDSRINATELGFAEHDAHLKKQATLALGHTDLLGHR